MHGARKPCPTTTNPHLVRYFRFRVSPRAATVPPCLRLWVMAQTTARGRGFYRLRPLNFDGATPLHDNCGFGAVSAQGYAGFNPQLQRQLLQLPSIKKRDLARDISGR